MSATKVAQVLILVVGVALAVWFLVDDTLEAWQIRLAWAGAITAGFAVVCLAIAYLIDTTPRRGVDRPDRRGVR